jgi:hypothetical protein
MSELTDEKVGCGCWIVILIIGIAIYVGYGFLDSTGWISHQEDTIITARSDWLVGESKVCRSITLNHAEAFRLSKETGYTMSYISCDDGPEHKMRVTFYGLKLQGNRIINWRCTRGDTSFLNNNAFTCYQTGTQQQ